MSRKNIEKYSFLYDLLKIYFVLMHKAYYKKIVVKGQENIPEDKPIIFAPNHQNALMDALALIFTRKGRMVFLARADIHINKVISSILTFFKILPIYRIRDGYASLKSNHEIFEKTIDVLRAKVPLVILPEGTHDGIHHLRPLKKGIARIAFQAEEACSNDLELQIVPVGLNYSEYEKSGSDLIVSFGKPLQVRNYIEAYKNNKAKGIAILLKDLSSCIGDLMINIPKNQYYDMIDILRRGFSYILIDKKKLNHSPWNRYKCEKVMVEILTEWCNENSNKSTKADVLKRKAQLFKEILVQNKIEYNVIANLRFKKLKTAVKTSLLLMLAPFFAIGFLLNSIPVIVGKYFASKTKDVQFRSSIKFAAALVLLPVFYLIQSSIFVSITSLPLFYIPIFLFAQPLFGWFAFRYRICFSDLYGNIRFMIMRIRSNNEWKRLISLKADIENDLQEIFADE